MKNKKAYLWNIIGRFIPQLIYLVATIVLTRLLTPKDFGIIGVLSIFMGVANTLIDAGLGGSLIKEKKIDAIDCSTIFVTNIVTSIGLYVLIYFGASYVEVYFNLAELGNILRILAICFVINGIGLIPNTLLIRDLKFKIIMYRNIMSTLIAAIIAIILAMNNIGVYALVGYQIINVLVNVIISFYITRYRISFIFRWDVFKRLFSFGFFTTICNVIDSMYENLLTFLFGKYTSITIAGYLNQAKKLEVSLTQTLISTVNVVSFPILTKMREDKNEFLKECNETTKTVSYLLFPMLWIIAVYSDLIITILYGDRWLPAAFYLTWLIYAGIFLVLESLYRNYVKSLTYVKQLMNITIIKRIIAIIILIGCAYISGNILIYAYIICTLIGLLFNVYLYSSSLQISFPIVFIELLKRLLPPCLILVPIFIVKSIPINIYLSLFTSMAIVLMFYVWGLPKLGIKLSISSILNK